MPLLVGVVERDGEFGAVEVLPPEKAEFVLDRHVHLPAVLSSAMGQDVSPPTVTVYIECDRESGRILSQLKEEGGTDGEQLNSCNGLLALIALRSFKDLGKESGFGVRSQGSAAGRLGVRVQSGLWCTISRTRPFELAFNLVQ